MAGVLNNCARPLVLKHKQTKTGTVMKVRIMPGDFVTIPDGEWNQYKKNVTVQGLLDEQHLVVGKKPPVKIADKDFIPDETTEEEISEEGSEE